MLLTNGLLMENKEEIHSIGEQLAKLLQGFFYYVTCGGERQDATEAANSG